MHDTSVGGKILLSRKIKYFTELNLLVGHKLLRSFIYPPSNI